VARSNEESTVVHPEVLTLHWEGPARAALPAEEALEGFEALEAALAAERERELAEVERSEQGRALWQQIQREAARRGDEQLWRRKLHAYAWVKLDSRGNAADYARRQRLNHATVRTWISEVAKLAYEVGYRLHEDKLLLVGSAPRGLRRLRELVNADAGSPEAWAALRLAEAEYRGEDPYFHLNEGHVLRARGELRASDETLKEGLAIGEARRVRALLWNARGQTFWDCEPGSSWPLPDHLERAERCFRRAAMLDQSTYFPFVNLAQMAVDARDPRRAEYWIGELSAARKRMTLEMQDALARYLEQAEWTRPVEPKRFWRSGPAKWLREAARRGALALLALALAFGLAGTPASAGPPPVDGVDTVRGGGDSSGAGGN
jgi:hypothetical protein